MWEKWRQIYLHNGIISVFTSLMRMINDWKFQTMWKRLLCVGSALFIFSLNSNAEEPKISPISAIDKNFTGKQTEYYANGNLKYEVNYKNGKKDGLETFWYNSGAMYIQTNYINDLEDGTWNQWYESGQLKLDAQYKNGKEHGHFQSWFANGKKRSEANFFEGKKTGIETYWYDTGEKKSETVYEDGQIVKEQNFVLESDKD